MEQAKLSCWMHLPQKQPRENVTFAIHQDVLSARPLLQLDLEVKYEKAKLNNVSVVTFTGLSELKDANLINDTVCIDEISMNYVTVEGLHAIEAKSLWIVVRETYQDSRYPNPEDYIREKFQEPWVIVNLSYPLRTSKNLSELVKSGQVSHGAHINNFNGSLKVVPNMPLGPEPLILPRSEVSYQARLHQAFCAVGKSKPALIILDYVYMKPTLEEIQAAKATTTHQEFAENIDEESQNLLVTIEAVKACQRPHGPPLLWFCSEYDSVNDEKASIKEWMKGMNRNISDRDLITDTECVPGYEADFIIYLGSSSSVSAYMSRCRGQFVHIE